MKNFIKLTQPGPPNPQTGEQSPPVEITAAVDKIMFCFKQPLQPVIMFGLGGIVMPVMGDYDKIVDELVGYGLKTLDTPEGLKAVVNPDQVLFYFTPELGIYNLMFAGKAGLTVKSTTAEVEGIFKSGSNLLLDSLDG